MGKINILFISLILFFLPAIALSETDPTQIAQFEEEFRALKPAPNKSVNSDYMFSQTALGTYYTTRTLNLIYLQNEALLSRYSEAIEKYDEMISQNNKIIELLKIIADGRAPGKPGTP